MGNRKIRVRGVLQASGVDQKTNNAISGNLAEIVNVIKDYLPTLGKIDSTGDIHSLIASVKTNTANNDAANRVMTSFLTGTSMNKGKMIDDSAVRVASIQGKSIFQKISTSIEAMTKYVASDSNESSQNSTSIYKLEFTKDSDDTLNLLAKVLSNKFEPIKGQTFEAWIDSFAKAISNALENNNLRTNIAELNKLLNSEDGNSINNLISNISRISSNASNAKTIDIIGNLISSIIDLGDFDKSKINNVKSNLKSLNTIIGGKGDESTSLENIVNNIYTLIGNISKNNNVVDSNLSDVHDLIFGILDIAKYNDDDSVESLKTILEGLTDIYKEDGAVHSLIQNIGKLASDKTLKTVISEDSPINNLDDMISGISKLGNSVDMKDIMRLFGVIITEKLILYGVKSLIESFSDENFTNNDLNVIIGTKSTKGKLEKIQYIIQKLAGNNSNDKDFANATGALEKLAKLMMISSFISAIAKPALFGLKKTGEYIESLDDLSEKLSVFSAGAITDDSLFDTIEGYTRLINDIRDMSFAAIICGLLSKLGSIGLASIDILIDKSVALIEKINNSEILSVSQDKVDNIDKITNAITRLGLVMLIAAPMAIIGIPGLIGLKTMELGLKALPPIISGINEIEDVEDTLDKVQSIAKIFTITGTLLIGAATYGAIIIKQLPELIVFAWGFNLFVAGLFSSINELTYGNDLDKMGDTLRSVAFLVAIAGSTLILGSLAMKFILIEDLISFVVAEAVFVGGLIGVYNLATRGMDKTIDIAESFTKLVVVSTAALILGSLAMKFISIGDLITFVVAEAVFVGGLIYAYNLATRGMDKTIDVSREFALLVAVSAATMVFGSIMMKVIKFKDLIGFTLTLGLFITGISIAYCVAGKILGSKEGMSIAREFNILIAVSAATLIIGGLFMMIPNMKESTASFAWTLGGFIFAVVGIYALAGKIMNKKLIALGYAIASLVAISGLVLLTGGMLMMLYPDLGSNVWEFLGCLAVLIGGMGLMLYLLGKNEKSLIKGTVALIGIGITVILAGYVMGELVKLNNQVPDNLALLGFVGIMIGTIVAFGAGVILLGDFATTGIGGVALAAGEAALFGIVTCVWIAGKAMQEIIKVMDMASKVKKIDSLLIVKNIGSFLEIVWALSPFMNPILDIIIVAAATVVGRLGVMLSDMASGVQAIANLSIPIYGEGGKIVGRRNLDTTDFQNAATNVEKIVTTLGGALISLYNKNPKMFSIGSIVGNWIGIKSPFSIVVVACSRMGDMISKISEGIKDMAELKVPIYKGTEIVGYRKLSDKDFEDAANNVKTIITTLGGAIIDLYNGKGGTNTDIDSEAIKAMFAVDWFGNLIGNKTPFGLVVTACTGMGNMISKISEGIKDMAELTIPIYGEGGKIVGKRKLIDKDFEAAANNVKIIISTLGNAIMALGNDKDTKWMFEDKSVVMKDGSCSYFSQMVKALSGMGSLMSGFTKAIKDVADLRLQHYTEDGTIVKGKFDELNPDDLKKGGKIYKNVEAIMTCLPMAMKTVYDDNKALFEMGFLDTVSSVVSGEQVNATTKVKDTLDGIDKILLSSIEVINKVINLKVNEKDLRPYGPVYAKMKNIVSCLPNAVLDALSYTKENGTRNQLMMIDEINDMSDDISKVFTTCDAIISNAVKTYNSVIDMCRKFKDREDIHTFNLIIDSILIQIPFSIERAFQKMPKSTSGNSNVESIQSDMLRCSTVLSTFISVYEDIMKFKKKLDKFSGKNAANELLFDMPKKIIDGILGSFDSDNNTKNHTTIADFEDKINRLQPSLARYKVCMDDLYEIYEKAPSDTSAYKNVIANIHGLNVAMANVKNVPEFKSEVQDLSAFTRTINSIDMGKAQTITNLIHAISDMAQRLGGLDNLTNTLANKLAKVLDRLVEELKLSAKTIDKADQMQKKRHEAIKNSINTITELLNQPVEVNVKQVTDDSLSSDDGGPQDTSSEHNTSKSDKPEAGKNNPDSPIQL